MANEGVRVPSFFSSLPSLCMVMSSDRGLDLGHGIKAADYHEYRSTEEYWTCRSCHWSCCQPELHYDYEGIKSKLVKSCMYYSLHVK